MINSGSDDDDDDDDDTIGRPLQILNTSRHSALKIFNNSAWAVARSINDFDDINVSVKLSLSSVKLKLKSVLICPKPDDNKSIRRSYK